MNRARSPRLITDSNITAFFQDSVTEALQRQRLEITDMTVVYLVNLLVCFTRSEALFEHAADGPALKPLALHYRDALEAPTATLRYRALRRLGDVALFVAGILSHSLRRKAVDVDYYVNMGGNAYAVLAQSTRGRGLTRVPSETWAELADNFVHCVDVLGEVNEQARPSTDADLLRLYETWLRTGSRRAGRLLREAGVEPVQAGSCGVRH